MGDTELFEKGDWRKSIDLVKSTIERLLERERLRNVPSKILIVDDDPNDVCLLCYELDKFNTEVSVCRNGEEAAQLIRETTFDFVFLDQKMPLTTGIEVLRQIAPGRISTQFFIVTGFGDSKLASEAFQFGALHIPKASTEEEWRTFRKLLARLLKPKP